LVDVGAEAGAIDRPIEDGCRRETVESQPRDDGVCLPVPARCVVVQPMPAGTAPVPADEIGGDAAFVEEDIAADVPERLPFPPVLARGDDVRPALFVSV
jgi:hypothetical protein